MTSLVWLWLGGILGALCRFHLSRLAQRLAHAAFPWGTLVINVSGSGLLGLLGALLAQHPSWPATPLSLFFGVGFCGAYTTFSSFAFESVELWQRGCRRTALLNVCGQPLLGGLAAWLGFVVGSS